MFRVRVTIQSFVIEGDSVYSTQHKKRMYEGVDIMRWHVCGGIPL